MPTGVVSQRSINFGAVPPGGSGPDISTFGGDLPSTNGGVQLAEATTDYTLTARITGDTSHFQIRDVFLLEWVEEVPEPPHPPSGEGPPRGHEDHVFRQLPKQKVLEVAEHLDGSRPINVKIGQRVLVRVKYEAHKIEGAYSGTLELRTSTGISENVDLSLFLADVVTTVSDTLNIAQGNRATLPLTVTSVMGPGIDVTYEMSRTQLHTGLTVLPNSIHLNPKETKSVSLVFQADSNAPIGPNDVAINQMAFRPSGLFFKVNILRPSIIVNPAQPNKIRSLTRNVRIFIPVSISLNGGSAADIFFSPGPLPAGVSMDNRRFFVQADTTVNLDMFLGNGTPDQFQFAIN